MAPSIEGMLDPAAPRGFGPQQFGRPDQGDGQRLCNLAVRTPAGQRRKWRYLHARVLDAGSDDHISRPFGMDELLARVRASLRRAAFESTGPFVVRTASFTADLSARTATTAAGAQVHLTPAPKRTETTSW